jgi:hypothetical protein
MPLSEAENILGFNDFRWYQLSLNTSENWLKDFIASEFEGIVEEVTEEA